MPTNNLDFSKMAFNVYDVPHGEDLLHRFPRLAVYSELSSYEGSLKGLPNRDMVIRHVAQFYDKEWPYQELRSYNERLDKSLEDAGFKKKKGEWPVEVQGVIKGEIPEVNNIIRCFLFKINNCRKFNAYLSIDKACQDTIENISMPINEADITKREKAFEIRAKNIENLMGYIEKIEKLEKDLFQDRDDVRDHANSDKDKSIFSAGAAEMLSELSKNK